MSLLKVVARLVALVLALLIVAAPLVAGYLYWRARHPGQSGGGNAAIVAPQQPGGIERALLGIYLGTKDAEIKRPAGNNPTPVKFTVFPGDTAEEIGANLKAYGLITDAELFRQLVKYQGVGQNLQAGEYELAATMSMEEVIAALQRSTLREARVTLREGWRLEQMAEVIAAAGVSTYDELVRVMRAGKYDESVLAAKPTGVSLEGYLYPDTYRLDMRWPAEQVVQLLVRTMDSRFTGAMRQQASAAGLTVHEALTVASLVEREAVLAAERPIVASVYLNRLRADMALEADATVQYALGYDAAQKRWWPNIQLDQLRTTESPYNTYLRRGLPPGPICSPSLASLQAVLQPAKTDYLFYYAKGDGSHAFARTFDEHLENQRKYQR